MVALLRKEGNANVRTAKGVIVYQNAPSLRSFKYTQMGHSGQFYLKNIYYNSEALIDDPCDLMDVMIFHGKYFICV